MSIKRKKDEKKIIEHAEVQKAILEIVREDQIKLKNSVEELTKSVIETNSNQKNISTTLEELKIDIKDNYIDLKKQINGKYKDLDERVDEANNKIDTEITKKETTFKVIAFIVVLLTIISLSLTITFNYKRINNFNSTKTISELPIPNASAGN